MQKLVILEHYYSVFAAQVSGENICRVNICLEKALKTLAEMQNFVDNWCDFINTFISISTMDIAIQDKCNPERVLYTV